MASDPAFEIESRPQREYDRAGRLSYEGTTLFRLEPAEQRPEATLRAYLDGVLDDGPYQYGDFHDLPMVVYLVRDRETGDVFRASIRDGAIRLHVLPETEAAGLRRFFGRLQAYAEDEWTVDNRTTAG
ncbi:hypothetical protein [Halorhabdus sp. CUG00001]|uniref:hypothetical protein n=1 Tax=Halorhabdus sp. CUG00001 TaxID=2600297 RepID=UPI00131EABA8|nr:hypothetical protein [Halorhabdus sp. CUG00001]